MLPLRTAIVCVAISFPSFASMAAAQTMSLITDSSGFFLEFGRSRHCESDVREGSDTYGRSGASLDRI